MFDFYVRCKLCACARVCLHIFLLPLLILLTCFFCYCLRYAALPVNLVCSFTLCWYRLHAFIICSKCVHKNALLASHCFSFESFCFCKAVPMPLYTEYQHRMHIELSIEPHTTDSNETKLLSMWLICNRTSNVHLLEIFVDILHMSAK